MTFRSKRTGIAQRVFVRTFGRVPGFFHRQGCCQASGNDPDPEPLCSINGALTFTLSGTGAPLTNPNFLFNEGVPAFPLSWEDCFPTWEIGSGDSMINVYHANDGRWYFVDEDGNGVVSDVFPIGTTPFDVNIWYALESPDSIGDIVPFNVCGGGDNPCAPATNMGQGVGVNSPEVGIDTVSVSFVNTECFVINEAWYELNGVLVSIPVPPPDGSGYIAFLTQYAHGDVLNIVLSNALQPSCDPWSMQISLDY